MSRRRISGTRLRRTLHLCVAGAGVCLLVVFPSACGPAPPPLANTHESATAVARAVLDALEHRDLARLQALALSEQEFRRHVWPGLPASREERNLPFSYVWGDLRQKSESSLRATLARHGGRRHELMEVVFGGESDYGEFRVHRAAMFRLGDPLPEQSEQRMIGSMIEMDGAWKVFSYVADE
jgi:hypothetical protein